VSPVSTLGGTGAAAGALGKACPELGEAAGSAGMFAFMACPPAKPALIAAKNAKKNNNPGFLFIRPPTSHSEINHFNSNVIPNPVPTAKKRRQVEFEIGNQGVRICLNKFFKKAFCTNLGQATGGEKGEDKITNKISAL
jgi:hypothetical protein